MKSGLKRIEATLGQLNSHELPPTEPLIMTQIAQEMAQEMAQDWVNVPIRPRVLQSFPLPLESPQPVVQSLTQPPELLHPPAPLPTSTPDRQKLGQKLGRKSGQKLNQKANPSTAQAGAPTSANSLPLPKAKPPSFSSHRHALNPNLAVGLLREVESVVITWQLELEQTVLGIQALYLEGPIVDGWLESHPVGSPQVMQSIGATTLRHAEIERLMDYVDEICRTNPTTEPEFRTSYRLCGLDSDGQLWSRPCPSQQVPQVSLAIARYQKLRILLARKQTLETRLHRLIQNLTLLHGQMQE